LTLVELLVGIVVGLIVLAGVSSVAVSTLVSNTHYLRDVRLTQDLRSVLQMLGREFRRAGYSFDAGSAVGTNINSNPFIGFTYTDANSDGVVDDDCILFRYDQDGDGVDDGNAEQLGFRFDAGEKAVEIRRGGADCSGGGWENVSDDKLVEVTDLTLTVNDENVDVPNTALGVGGTNAQIVIRELTISITGRLKAEPEISKTVQETVRLRNNGYVPAT